MTERPSNAFREHQRISWTFHQAATQIHLPLSSSQVFTQRSFVNFHETSPVPFGHHPRTATEALTAKRTHLNHKRNSERTLLCTTRFLLNFPIIRFVQRTSASKNICILLCPCNPRTAGVQTGGHVDLLIFPVSASIFFVRGMKSLIKVLLLR